MKELGALNELGGWAAKGFPLLLMAGTVLVTGCPHNEYIVQLTPEGTGVERTLTFYCADGTNATTGGPNYQSFDPAELKAITALYPAGDVTSDGDRHTACAEFTNDLPGDVGGAGDYSYLATTMGSAGVYSERFRGNDDFADLIQQRLKAADRVTDLMVGWSQATLDGETNYDKLHQFLDVDFRRDVKNVATYFWEGQLVSNYNTNAAEEFVVRFGLYLWERGYFKVQDIPRLFVAASDNNSQWIMEKIQRLVATKMGVPEDSPIPASLAFLTDEKAMDESLSNYLAGTKDYRDRLARWEQEVKTKPDTKRPDPNMVMNDVMGALINFDLFGTSDHLVVRLTLPRRPDHSNGRWDETRKQVVWETDFDGRTNRTHIPVMCYANWSVPDEQFQTEHLGKIALSGDRLGEYCLWRNGLDPRHSQEWEAFLATLRPGADLVTRLEAFRFSDEPPPTVGGKEKGAALMSDYPRELIKEGLEEVAMARQP